MLYFDHFLGLIYNQARLGQIELAVGNIPILNTIINFLRLCDVIIKCRAVLYREYIG